MVRVYEGRGGAQLTWRLLPLCVVQASRSKGVVPWLAADPGAVSVVRKCLTLRHRCRNGNGLTRQFYVSGADAPGNGLCVYATCRGMPSAPESADVSCTSVARLTCSHGVSGANRRPQTFTATRRLRANLAETGGFHTSSPVSSALRTRDSRTMPALRAASYTRNKQPGCAERRPTHMARTLRACCFRSGCCISTRLPQMWDG